MLYPITVDDLFEVYAQLKDKHPLVMTTAFALDQGFTEDCPVLVGKAHGRILELYEAGGDFVLDVMDEAETKGTHWHPYNVERAVEDITEFMDGKADYELYPFPRPKKD